MCSHKLNVLISYPPTVCSLFCRTVSLLFSIPKDSAYAPCRKVSSLGCTVFYDSPVQCGSGSLCSNLGRQSWFSGKRRLPKLSDGLKVFLLKHSLVRNNVLYPYTPDSDPFHLEGEINVIVF